MSGDKWCFDETMTLDYAMQILGVNRKKYQTACNEYRDKRSRVRRA